MRGARFRAMVRAWLRVALDAPTSAQQGAARDRSAKDPLAGAKARSFLGPPVGGGYCALGPWPWRQDLSRWCGSTAEHRIRVDRRPRLEPGDRAVHAARDRPRA